MSVRLGGVGDFNGVLLSWGSFNSNGIRSLKTAVDNVCLLEEGKVGRDKKEDYDTHTHTAIP